MVDQVELATHLLERARKAGADAADVLVAQSTDFSASVRRGEIETLKDAGSKALGLRVFVGRRSASSHTSDFSRAALETFVSEVVEMARITGEDPAAGLPDEEPPGDLPDLELHHPEVSALPTGERIERARRAEAAALEIPGITNSHGSSFACHEGSVVLANTLGFAGGYATTSCSLSVVPLAERDGVMERDYWYTTGRSLAELLEPEAVGRIAAQRTLRRLGARRIKTRSVPVVFDPETSASLLGHLFDACSGYAVYRNATFLKDRVGEAVASPLISVVDDGRLPGRLGSRPFDGEGLATRRNLPVEAGILKHYLCDSYAGRKLGLRPAGCARRGISGGPSVGSSNLSLEAGSASPESIIGEVEDGLYVTDLIGFGVNLVTGDYSQGAAGLWIEKGCLTHPVNEVTIAGNLRQMLLDVDAVGNDLEVRGSVNAPTLRIRKLTVAG